MIGSHARVLACTVFAVGCGSVESPEPRVEADAAAPDVVGDSTAETAAGPSIPSAELPGCLLDPGPPSPVLEDPLAENDTLEHALAGFPASSSHPQLVARFTFRVVAPIPIESPAPVVCVLEPEAAPETVKSFVGLSRGSRKFQTFIGDELHYGRYFDGKLLEVVQADVAAMFGTNATHLAPGYYLPRENLRDGREGDLYAQVAQRNQTTRFPISAGTITFAWATRFVPIPTRFGRCDAAAVRAVTQYKSEARLAIDKVTLARCPDR